MLVLEWLQCCCCHYDNVVASVAAVAVVHHLYMPGIGRKPSCQCVCVWIACTIAQLLISAHFMKRRMAEAPIYSDEDSNEKIVLQIALIANWD